MSKYRKAGIGFMFGAGLVLVAVLTMLRLETAVDAGFRVDPTAGPWGFQTDQYPVPVFLNQDSIEVEAELVRQLAVWNSDVGFRIAYYAGRRQQHEIEGLCAGVGLFVAADPRMKKHGTSRGIWTKLGERYKFTGADIRIATGDGVHDEFLGKKVRHELGHGFGLEHDTIGASVMFEEIGRATQLRLLDADRIRLGGKTASAK